MSLSRKHYSPYKSERKCHYYHPVYKTATASMKEFDRVERLLDEMTVDYCNGLTKSDIYLKLADGQYENAKGKKMAEITFEEYWRCVQARLSFDRERDVETAKDSLYAKYIALYHEAVQGGMTLVAKSILDSLMKLQGVDKQQNINIQPEGDITIKFGFDGDKS